MKTLTQPSIGKLNHLPGHARVWVYQANRKLSDGEVRQIAEKAGAFVNEWAAHGTKLFSGYAVLHNHFLVLAVDGQQAAASGCSIDSSVHFVQDMGKSLNVDFFNRMNVAYQKRSSSEIQLTTLAGFEGKAKDGSIFRDDIVFNNLVSTLAELKQNWRVPVSESWHSRYF